MASKEKVKLVRGDDFDTVDQELAEAMSLVDAANERVAQLLNEEREGPAASEEDNLFGEPAPKPEADAAAVEAAPAAEEKPAD
jgi:ribosomal protein L14E/L6E/L27E